MASQIRIALIQFQPKLLALEANFAYCAAEIRAAARQGAQLAVLPEYHLTGWCPEDGAFVAACARSAPYLGRYQALARETGVSIVPGTLAEAHRTTAGGGDGATLVTDVAGVDEPLELRNMAYFVAGGSGAVLGSYQKANLWHSERPYLTAAAAPGGGRCAGAGSSSSSDTAVWTPHKAFDTPWTIEDAATRTSRPLRAGLLVCWDVAFPEAFRALVADGADLIVIPSCWDTALPVDSPDAAEAAAAQQVVAVNPASEAVFLRAALVARAFENSVAVAYCNTGGLSSLSLPLLGSLGVIEPGVAATQLVDFDPAVQHVSELWYKVRADMGKPGWHYEHGLPARAAAGGGAK